MTILYLSLVCLLVYLWVVGELNTREAEFHQVRQTYILKQKEIIRNQVEQAVHYIRHEKSLAGKRVRQTVKSRTLEAWETATYIWKKNKEIHDRETIERMIHDALFAATWDGGKGYYFAEDLAGTEKINRNNPELEGVNLMEIRDSMGKYVMKAILGAIQSPDKEGFATYHWNKPEFPGIHVPKISYVKYFAPLDWVIGNGKYIVDEEEKIKTEVLAYLEEIRYGDNHYVFAGTMDGLSLSGPFQGINKLDIADANGVKIVEELIRAAKSKGGFVRYVAPKFEGLMPEAKISYAQAIDGWDWYIGTGVHIDAIEEEIQRKQADIRADIATLLVKTTMILTLWLLASFGLAWLFSKKIRKNLNFIHQFFSRSAAQHQPIPQDQIFFKEFFPLTSSANRMIRERNASEAALKQSEKKYRRLFEHSKDAILIIENGRYVDCNKATVDMLGYEHKDQFLGTHPADISPETQTDGQASSSKALEMMDLAIQRGSHRFEWNHIKANGDIFPLEILLTPIFTERGKRIIHTTWRDITDRKKTEAMMIQTEKMITVGGLAAGMAHEINNPLAGMMQSAQVIQNRLEKQLPANEIAAQEAGISLEALKTYMDKREISKFLAAMHETGNRAAKIVQNMLNFIQKKTAEKTIQNLSHILDQTIELARNDYSLKKNHDIRKIDIEKSYAPDTPQVLCDESNLQQVFFNIIKNAAQAMAEKSYGEERPKIKLSISAIKGSIQIRIKDNGPGMDKTTSNRIFEPFYTTKPVNQGTGLGLSVSYFIIVQDHGGSLSVESTLGKGTEFIITLPVLPNPDI